MAIPTLSKARDRARFDIPTPKRIGRLPRDRRGYPVPWFVEWRDDEPLFPIMDARKWVLAVKHARCWVCGDHMGRWMTFVVGPMCTINRISAEPPTHHECAEYATKVCPFMLNPSMRRVPTEQFGKVLSPGGIMEEQRNPGIMALWRTRSFAVEITESGPILKMGDPQSVDWWCHGRPATRDEAIAGFDDGAAFLRSRALELDGPGALPTLDRLVEVARRTVLTT